MKFKATLRLTATSETIQRMPGFWDKLKKTFGAQPNLDTDRVRTRMQSNELVMGAKKALERLGVDNAVALMIDGQVLFEDKTGKGGDAPDLFLAFYENEDVFGREFKDLRLAVEHREAGLHYIIEIVAQGEHQKDQSTALVHIAGRVVDLEPKSGEDADAFRARVMPLLATPALAEASRLQFESWAAKAEEALRAALPGVTITSAEAKSLVERPKGVGKTRERPAPTPTDPRYDPYDRWHPSPMSDVMTMMFWGSMMSWAWHPHYVVVDQSGHELGNTESIAEGNDFSGDGAGEGGGADDPGGDAGGDDGGGDFDSGGGDFDGGDFGGDFGDF